MDLRHCYVCDTEKPLAEFYPHKRDGYTRECRACRKIQKQAEYLRNKERYIERARAWKKEHRARVNELSRAKYDPVKAAAQRAKYRESMRSYLKRYYAEHREAIKARTRVYAQVNADKVKANAREWRAKNQDRCRATQHQYYEKTKAERLVSAAIWRQRNRARLAEMSREWRRANKDRLLEQARAYRAANRERLRQHNRRWRERNPEAARASVRKWNERNPELARLRSRDASMRRNARKRGGVVSKADLARVIARDGMRCYLCGKRVKRKDLSFDHVVPLSRGGAHCEANLRVTHLLCNISKGTKLLHLPFDAGSTTP